MTKKKSSQLFAEDDKYSVRTLAWLRAPSLFVGLILGLALSFVTSKFAEVLEKDVTVAFFIPFIVYMADAVGTQSLSIYTRTMKDGKDKFHIYLIKESGLGILLGIFFGCITFVIVSLWFSSMVLAATVSLSVFCAVSAAPVVNILVTEALQLKHLDPAVGGGPIATVIQDTVSIVVYGAIASAILLR